MPFRWSGGVPLVGDSCASQSILKRSVVQFERASGALPTWSRCCSERSINPHPRHSSMTFTRSCPSSSGPSRPPSSIVLPIEHSVAGGTDRCCRTPLSCLATGQCLASADASPIVSAVASDPVSPSSVPFGRTQASPGSYAKPSSRLSINSSGSSVLRTPGTEVAEEDVCRRCR